MNLSMIAVKVTAAKKTYYNYKYKTLNCKK